MGTRRKSRELCLQMLFQLDMGKQTPEHVRKTFWNERADLDSDTRGFTEDLFKVATERQQEIDELIQKHAEHWRMERMAAVDRNLLRSSVAEFLGYPATPRPVVINEALEIARKFSSPESVQFINGVLDSVSKELGPAANPSPVSRQSGASRTDKR
jgi:N utilization substance protein B